MLPPLLLLLTSLVASPFNLDGTVVAEGRAGSSPVLVGQAPQSFASAVVSPQVAIWLRGHQLDLQLGYLPRLTWQTPNQLGLQGRPLILHQAGLAFTGRPAGTIEIQARAVGSIGEPDYSILPQLIGTGQAALPQVQRIATVSASARLQQELSRRWRLTLAGDAAYFRVLDDRPADADLPPAPPLPLPRQTMLGATPGVLFAVTRNDDLALTSPATYATYANGREIVSLAPTLAWRARRAGGDELRLAVGLAYTRDVGTGTASSAGGAFAPTGGGEVVGKLLSEDEYSLSARLRLTLEQYVDPVLATSGPRALAAGQLLVLAGDWSVAVQVDISAGLRTTPLPGDPDETAFSLKVPVRCRISADVSLEAGGLWADRAPALASPMFAFHQRQLWAYVALTATTRERSPRAAR